MLETIPPPSLITKEYSTLSQIRGPLVFVERTAGVSYDEIVEIIGPDGEIPQAVQICAVGVHAHVLR